MKQRCTHATPRYRTLKLSAEKRVYCWMNGPTFGVSIRFASFMKEFLRGHNLQLKFRMRVFPPVPSKISTVNITTSEKNGFVLTWTSPAEPNGPIDGFLVKVNDLGGEVSNRTLDDPSARSLTFVDGELTKGKW